MPLSRRLHQINRMAKKHYHHIWDCCCDHGQLGMELLQRSAADTVHFVDILDHLMLEIKTQLSANTHYKSHWQVHCLDVAQLPISETDINDSHLVIIAGVGGDLLIELVEKILSDNPGRNIEFILCPVYHQYKVRCALIELGLKLSAEDLLREKRKFYEILHVSRDSEHNISPVGSLMWDFRRLEHRDYYQRMLEHYGRMARQESSEVDAKKALAQYRSLQNINTLIQ